MKSLLHLSTASSNECVTYIDLFARKCSDKSTSPELSGNSSNSSTQPSNHSNYSYNKYYNVNNSRSTSRSPDRDCRLQKPQKCKYFANGHCKWGDNCRFSHMIDNCNYVNSPIQPSPIQNVPQMQQQTPQHHIHNPYKPNPQIHHQIHDQNLPQNFLSHPNNCNFSPLNNLSPPLQQKPNPGSPIQQPSCNSQQGTNSHQQLRPQQNNNHTMAPPPLGLAAALNGPFGNMFPGEQSQSAVLQGILAASHIFPNQAAMMANPNGPFNNPNQNNNNQQKMNNNNNQMKQKMNNNNCQNNNNLKQQQQQQQQNSKKQQHQQQQNQQQNGGNGQNNKNFAKNVNNGNNSNNNNLLANNNNINNSLLRNNNNNKHNKRGGNKHNNNNEGQTICEHYLQGRCKFGKSCFKFHPAEISTTFFPIHSSPNFYQK